MRFIVTAENLTRSQILALRSEAATAGDHECVDVCDLALMGIEADRARVAEMINDAAAQAE